MGLGVSALGRVSRQLTADQRTGVAERVGRAAHERFAPFATLPVFFEDRRGFSIELFPGAEPASFVINPSGEVEFDARTTPIGPGYHHRVCELIREIERDHAVTWKDVSDETDFYHDRSVEGLVESMAGWAHSLFKLLLDDGPGGLGAGSSLCMGVGVRYKDDRFAKTPFGPRDREYFERAAKDASVAAEFVPWMNPQPDARTFLMAAEELMWCEVLWRPACTTGGEDEFIDSMEAPGAQTIRRAISLLEHAYALDAGLRYPWREWCELCELDGREPPAHAASRAERIAGPLIGYRRNDVVQRVFPGVSVEIPGSFATAYDDGSFISGDGDRSVCMTLFEHETSEPSPRAALAARWDELVEQDEGARGEPEDAQGSEFRWSGEGFEARAIVRPEDFNGEPGFTLRAILARVDRFAHVTITFPNEDHRQWAEAVVRSVTMEQTPLE